MRPVIYTIHHQACTGGTLFSKCLAVMPNIVLVSEVHPLNSGFLFFNPMDPVQQFQVQPYWNIEFSEEELKAIFLERLGHVHKKCEENGLKMVVRDHSHYDYMQHLNRTRPLLQALTNKFEIRSVVTIRNPVESFLSMKKNKWLEDTIDFNEYCRRLQMFYNDYSDVSLFHYENFLDDPSRTMQEICFKLGVEYDSSFLTEYNKVRLTGDSGRADQTAEIVRRPIRTFSEAFRQEVLLSPEYKELVQRFDYDKDPKEMAEKVSLKIEETKHSSAINSSQAEASLTSQKSNEAKKKADNLIAKGEGLYAQGNYEGAIANFKEAHALLPTNSEALNNLGAAYWQINKKKEALETLSQARALNKLDRITVVNLGHMLLELGYKELARDIYLSFLCEIPEDEVVLEAWGQLADSAADKEKVINVEPKPNRYLVSAIVSTYCSEAFIEECLANLEAQTIADDIEIVIVDAASPENEQEIVKRFQERYCNIRYIRTRGRIGVYAAWNIAIKEALGKYCISVSTNDQLRDDACEFLSNALERDPDCALIYGDTYLTEIPHETFEQNSHYGFYKWPEYNFELLTKTSMVGPHPMWRKSVHDVVGYFDERYIADGDQEFWLRIGERFKLKHVDAFTGLQWITPDAVSQKGETPMLELAHIQSLYQIRLQRRGPVR